MTMEELREQRRQFKVLQENETYRRLVTERKAQIRLRQQQVASMPVNGLDDIVRLLTARGELAGMQYSIAQLGLEIEHLGVDIEDALEEEEIQAEAPEQDKGDM